MQITPPVFGKPRREPVPLKTGFRYAQIPCKGEVIEDRRGFERSEIPFSA